MQLKLPRAQLFIDSVWITVYVETNKMKTGTNKEISLWTVIKIKKGKIGYNLTTRTKKNYEIKLVLKVIFRN